MVKLLIAIPTHSYSAQLQRTLDSIEAELDSIKTDCHVLLTNSGTPYTAPCIAEIMQISTNDYWTGAVKRIYEYAHSNCYTSILLMNHDCTLGPGCLKHLLDLHGIDNKSVYHATVLYKGTNIIWWAGTVHRCMRRPKFLFKNLVHGAQGQSLIPTDSMMGQCLIIPIAAAKVDYLRIKYLPHYFSDSVHTALMKKDGYSLYVAPMAVAYSDQSDELCKLKRIAPTSLRKLYSSWVEPYSNRNLKSSFYSAYFHQSCMLGRLLFPFYEAVGKLVYTIYLYIRIKFFKQSVTKIIGNS